MYRAIVFIMLHFLGIVYVMISTCMECARKDHHVGIRPKRRGAKMCNVLILWHTFLSAVALILVIVYYPDNTDDDVVGDYHIDRSEFGPDATMFFLLWLSAAANYSFSILFLAVVATFSQYFCIYKKSGCIHAGHVFEVFTFILFWTSVCLMLICLRTDCSGLPSILDQYADTLFGLGAILLFIFYMILLSLAIWNSYADKLISKDEAVNLIHLRMQEQVYIGWAVQCGHMSGNLCHSKCFW